MNLKKSKQVYMGSFGARKGRSRLMQLYYYLKISKKKLCGDTCICNTQYTHKRQAWWYTYMFLIVVLRKQVKGFLGHPGLPAYSVSSRPMRDCHSKQDLWHLRNDSWVFLLASTWVNPHICSHIHVCTYTLTNTHTHTHHHILINTKCLVALFACLEFCLYIASKFEDVIFPNLVSYIWSLNNFLI